MIAVLNASGSPVLPGNTSTATGRPSGSVSSPYSICMPAALAVPGIARTRPARSCVPSTHEEDRSNIAIPPRGQVPGGELLLDLPLPGYQPVHRRVHVIGARVGHAQVGAERGVPAAHQGTVDSFDSGRTARDTISA